MTTSSPDTNNRSLDREKELLLEAKKELFNHLRRLEVIGLLNDLNQKIGSKTLPLMLVPLDTEVSGVLSISFKKTNGDSDYSLNLVRGEKNKVGEFKRMGEADWTQEHSVGITLRTSKKEKKISIGGVLKSGQVQGEEPKEYKKLDEFGFYEMVNEGLRGVDKRTIEANIARYNLVGESTGY